MSKSTELLQRFSDAIEDVAAEVSPSVVTVGDGRRTGTGIVWDAEGHIVTAAHVVERGAQSVAVSVDGKSLQAEVVGRDRYADTALLKVEASGLRPIQRGDSKALKVGQFVLALANPFSAGTSATSGIITSAARSIRGWSRMRIEDAIITDAPLNPGYSGGPLVSASGSLIGMNVAYFSSRGIAIPIASIEQTVKRLATGQPQKRAYLGVVSQPIRLPQEIAAQAGVDQESAMIVLEVEADSAARRAGIAIGDVLLKLNGTPVTDYYELEKALSEEAIGKESTLLVLRGEKATELTVSPGEVSL